jgi:hypothetical protein
VLLIDITSPESIIDEWTGDPDADVEIDYAIDQVFLRTNGSDENNFPLSNTQTYINDVTWGIESLGDSQFLDVWLA